jgi:Response regulator containing a CheY-like receiver domain and an HTH DNA-binding domain
MLEVGMEKIRVMMVDDHELFRLSLRTAIECRFEDIIIVGEAGSGATFFSLLRTVDADIVLLDIALPGMSGIEIARRLKTEQPDMKILAVSAENDLSTVEEMLEIGIEGFVSKSNCKPDILAEAIYSVMQGLDYFGRDISSIISRIYIAKKKTMQVSEEFSEQEKHIIELCLEGLPAKLIADRLSISTRTVDWHKSNMFSKLGINSTIELVQFAIKNKII